MRLSFSEDKNEITPRHGTDIVSLYWINELNAEGVNNAMGISPESRSEEPGQPLRQTDPFLVADLPA